MGKWTSVALVDNGFLMKCPFCHMDNDRVIDSRSNDDGTSIRRRRECFECNGRYTTYERLDEIEIKVVKKNGVREPYDPAKVRDGIAKACWKRPISDEQIDGVVTLIQAQLMARLDREIGSTELGELVMEHLRGLDQVAYVRFASVYRDFTDARDFMEEVRPMLNTKPSEG
jgi:transcriptional repressor NrdR